MESFEIVPAGNTLEVRGIPDAVKLVAVDGPLAKRLADLALHRSDLTFAVEALEAFEAAPSKREVVNDALWASAIVAFCKCFGDSDRFQLVAEKVYKGEPPMAFEVFRYFKSLRNKHIVHDENPFAQAAPAAALNDGTKDYKVEKVLCMTTRGVTYEPEDRANLHRLATKALAWVDREFDTLCDLITSSLERESYESLAQRPSPMYNAPTADQVHASRRGA